MTDLSTLDRIAKLDPQAARQLTALKTEHMRYFAALKQIEQAHDASADELRAMAMAELIPF